MIIKLCLWAHTCKDVICMIIIDQGRKKGVYVYIGEKVLYNIEIKLVLI